VGGRLQTADAALIAVTGYRHERDRKTAMNAGFPHHLVKSVDPVQPVGLLAGAA
jgi:CheY-like chemotaxis protein